MELFAQLATRPWGKVQTRTWSFPILLTVGREEALDEGEGEALDEVGVEAVDEVHGDTFRLEVISIKSMARQEGVDLVIWK